MCVCGGGGGGRGEEGEKCMVAGVSYIIHDEL